MYTNHVHQGHNPVSLHNPYPTHMPNGHAHPPHPPHPPQHAAPTNHRAHTQAPKERINVQAVPSVTVQNNELVVGDSNTSACLPPYIRGYTVRFPSLTNATPRSRFGTIVYTAQGGRRWIFWHGMVMRLAWDATAQYTRVCHAMRARGEARIRGQEAGRRQEDEKDLGGRLGRV